MLLLPQPRSVKTLAGTFTVPDAATLSLAVPAPSVMFFTARRLQAALRTLKADLTIHGDDFPATIHLSIAITPEHPQGYSLHITESGISIIGQDEAGLFYGVLTLIQLLHTEGCTLPHCEIQDWPDFPHRGVMLDVSRDKVPTMETLYDLIDLLASWKINQVQLYLEHTFAYRNHRVVWENASPFTAEEMLALDAYCAERFIEFVPNQNSFGHMNRWFKFPQYLELAEVKEPFFFEEWGVVLPPYSLSPAAPGSLPLVNELFTEFLPNFRSRLFNVGCDETVDLGLGMSRELVAEKGKGRVYLDFLLEIYALTKAHNRTMMFWGDIINQYPELVPELPKDTVALEWGYEADHEFPRTTKLFGEAAIPFYVCPGTSSWRSIAGRTDNSIENIRSAVEHGLKYGAIGVLNTDWGDEGHWQTLPISYLGFAYGAALSWYYDGNVTMDLPAALDAFAFHDVRGVMGRLAYDLGNVYKETGVLLHNSSVLFHGYRLTPERAQEMRTQYPDVVERLHQTLESIDRIAAALDQARMAREDAALIQREFALAVRMLKQGARQLLYLLGDTTQERSGLLDVLDSIEQEYRAVWLLRNRPGGLDDSAARFNIIREHLT
ncbi:MAG: hypothetical protein OHK0046_24760 [Anaerolineae bacterium]